MADIMCFGEIMLRLATPRYEKFTQANTFEITFGGGEANVAVSLANFGMDADFVTKLPNNPMGTAAANELRKYGVDTGKIVYGGDRLGIYYLETGASQRPSKVVYDRKYSAISEADDADFDWNNIFQGVKWFHFTGITPAISDSAAAITLAALKTAKEMGITVSCDLNYRKKLWSKEKACKIMTELMSYVDICISNEEDAADVFGIKAPDTDITAGAINREGYQYVAEELQKRFGFKHVAITLRESISASRNIWSGMLYDGKDFFYSNRYDIQIVDRVGGGDSFGAGLIYSFMNGYDGNDAIEFAAAASCLKQTIHGDFNFVSVEEVKALAGGDGSGRVQR